jgi:hypothetical protein
MTLSDCLSWTNVKENGKKQRLGELLFQSRKCHALLQKQPPRIRGGCFYFTK